MKNRYFLLLSPFVQTSFSCSVCGAVLSDGGHALLSEVTCGRGQGRSLSGCEGSRPRTSDGHPAKAGTRERGSEEVFQKKNPWGPWETAQL